MDTELGIKAGGGFDYFISDQLALNVEGSYTWSDADMTVAAFGSQASASIDTDYWSVTGGFKYYFD
jgi:outer membrane protein W